MAPATERGRWPAILGLLGAWVLAMLVVVRPAHAASDEPRVAVPPLVVEGEVPGYLVADLANRLRSGLGATAQAVETSTTCKDATCWMELAKSTNTTHVAHATLTVTDRDYDVRADLVDGRSGEVLATVTRACDICGSEELATTFEDVGDALRRKLASSLQEPPALVITSVPPGATVQLDGAPVGTTPLTVEVTAGEHEIEVGMPDHITQRRRLAFVDGVRQEWKVVLVDVPREDRPTGRPLRIAGWSAIGVGLAGLGVGIGVAVLDENPMRSRCSGENVDIEGNCKYRYNTLAGGIASAVVGAAILGTGIALVIVDRKKSRDRRVALLPTLRGVALSGRF
jgi:hypothetical protein